MCVAGFKLSLVARNLAFKLFNRTQIVPVQKRIADAFDRVCGEPGVLTITPFTLDGVGQTVQ